MRMMMGDHADDLAWPFEIDPDEELEEIEYDYNVETQTVTIHYPEWVVDEQRDR